VPPFCRDKGWGPCARPRPGHVIGQEITHPNRIVVPQGQAQGPHPSPRPPLAPNEFCRSKRGIEALQHPVVGALCLSSSGLRHPAGHHQTPPNRVATRTSTRPPLLSTSTPCPYRTKAVASCHSPIRLSNIIRMLGTQASRWGNSPIRLLNIIRTGVMLLRRHTGCRPRDGQGRAVPGSFRRCGPWRCTRNARRRRYGTRRWGGWLP
jgi:hypothetical protein